MKSPLKIAIIVCLFLTASATTSSEEEDEEARVENEEPQYAVPEPVRDYEDRGRFGRLLFHNHQFMNMILKTPDLDYAMKNPDDPFAFLRDTYPLPKGFTSPLQEYDYVIIGAGSAGSVLAARLSEDSATVLLLEAGKPEMFFTDVPAIAHYFQSTDYGWEYKMEKQEDACLAMENQQCLWPRGRAVGGTSVINYMIYTRGRPQDWDRIAAKGNYGWSYKDVLHYYKKSERAKLKDFKNSTNHGYEGELPVEDVPFRTKLSKAFLQGGEELGQRIVDYNAPDGMGFGYVQTTTHFGHRCSAAKAFLHPNKKRKNLHILTYARVTKIHIDPITKEAHAVEYVKNNLKYTVRARREIILSAGPLASPQLLMLSGVGPKEDLEEFGIPVIKDLRVGRILYDHITFPGLVFLVNGTLSFTENKILNPEYLEQWLQFGDGPLTTIGGVEAIGYVKTPVSDDPENVPDMELISAGCSIVSDSGGPFSKGMGIRSDFYRAVYSSINSRDTWTALPMLLHPKSKGYMRLRSANPFDFPKFYGNYLSHPQDVAAFVYIINYVIKLSKTKKFQKYGATLHTTPFPNCIEHKFGSDNYWECAVRTLATSLHHQVGTCKMGPSSDPEAVVDPELRVHGIKRLRVADSGIIPGPISAHTHAPAVMIGEKAADMIKAYWAKMTRRK